MNQPSCKVSRCERRSVVACCIISRGYSRAVKIVFPVDQIVVGEWRSLDMFSRGSKAEFDTL